MFRLQPRLGRSALSLLLICLTFLAAACAAKGPPDAAVSERADAAAASSVKPAAAAASAPAAEAKTDQIAAPAPSAPPAAPKVADESIRVELPGGGFEVGEPGWSYSSARGMAQVTEEAAFSGGRGLRFESPEDDSGARVVGPRVPAKEGVVYRLAFQGRVLAGGGTNVHLVFFDKAGTVLKRDYDRVWGDRGKGWLPYQVESIPPAGTVALAVLVQRPQSRPPSYKVDLDAFELFERPIRAVAPWPGTYKLRPEDKARLTAADVVGPDGRVYPDFTYAGVPGGIPDLPVLVRLADLGARPGEDISALIEKAAERVAAAGGGAILIGEGEYRLDQPVMIFSDNVVIRGSGRGKTRLLFGYHIPYGEIYFPRLKSGDEIGPDGGIEMHANPKDLVTVELRCGDKSLTRRTRADHWGNTFSIRVSARLAMDAVGEGTRTFTALAEYANGKKVERSIEVRLKREAAGSPGPLQLGAISFVGRGVVPDRLPLIADGRRGATSITLAPGHGFAVGDRLSLVAPASERWKSLVGFTGRWEIQAQNIHEVVAVEGGRVTLNQPLRTIYSVEDGSFVQKMKLISGGGVEDLEIEQLVVPNQGPPGPIIPATLSSAIEDVWTNGITFSHAWGVWIKNVTIRNAGRSSAYFPMCKHIEVRDCLFDGAIFKGGGGTGYVGFDRTWDSLMDGVEARDMRHGPNLQWNASGNVIRNGRFLGSDGQWHAGFTLENLFENNFIDARGKGGSYGHGLYASGPTSGIHGPQGPRNVVYNNDVVSRLNGLHMLGGNEAWLILYNRFVVGSGRAVYVKEKSFDHTIVGNVFVVRRPESPPVFLGVDCVGVDFTDNVFYGVSGPLVGFEGGRTSLASDERNVANVEAPDSPAPRPQPAVPSIYQWQRDHLAAIRADASSRAAAESTP